MLTKDRRRRPANNLVLRRTTDETDQSDFAPAKNFVSPAVNRGVEMRSSSELAWRRRELGERNYRSEQISSIVSAGRGITRNKHRANQIHPELRKRSRRASLRLVRECPRVARTRKTAQASLPFVARQRCSRPRDQAARTISFSPFVSEKSVRRPISSMPGVEQLPPNEVAAELRRLSPASQAVILFGIPNEKDEEGSGAYAEGVQRRFARSAACPGCS